MGLGGYDNEKLTSTTSRGLDTIRPITIREEIEMHIRHLEEQLDIKRRLLKLLDSNPAIEEFQNLSRRS